MIHILSKPILQTNVKIVMYNKKMKLKKIETLLY